MEIHKGKIGPLDGPKKPCGGLWPSGGGNDKKPCGGFKPSCLGCDPDPNGPDYKPTREPDEDDPVGGNMEPDEGRSPDVEYDPDGGAYEQQCLYPSLP